MRKSYGFATRTHIWFAYVSVIFSLFDWPHFTTLIPVRDKRYQNRSHVILKVPSRVTIPLAPSSQGNINNV